MTLGTLGSNPHKDLSNVFREFETIQLHLVEIGRWTFKGPTRRTNQFSHNLIDRCIGCDLIREQL